MTTATQFLQMLQTYFRDCATVLTSTLALILCLLPHVGWGQRVINAPSPTENVEFGWSIASAGDVNGDGIEDLIVGDPNIDATFNGAEYNEAGKAYVYSGGSGGTRLFTLKSPNEGSSTFGYAVGSVGDVNGDGTPDLVVGAPQQNPNDDGTAEGQAYVFDGKNGSLLRQMRPSPGTGSDSEIRFGRSVDAIGDVNGDGVPDVLVGARKQGYLISGASGTPILETFSSIQSGFTFTGTIEAMGDITGDGVPDVAIEATAGTRTQNDDLVKAYVYDGDTGAKIRTLATSKTGSSGPGVGLDNLEDIGDVNNDGVPDLAVGSPFDPILANFKAGRVFLFSGANGDELRVIDAPDPNSSKTYFGLSLARTADYDGDGLRDLLVGAPFQLDQSDTDKIGHAYLISTDPSRSNPVIDDFISPKPTPKGAFGYSAAAVGDVNGDGVPDVALAAKGEPSGSGGNDAGRVYQFSGSQLSAVKSSTKSINGNGSQSFGNTGVSITFAGTGGASGSATVQKFAGQPLGTGSISQTNVSTYSFAITTSSLSVGAGTKVRFDVSTLAGIPNPGNGNVQIYKRDEGATTFNSVSTTYDSGAGELVADVSGFSEFVFASNNNALPVELASVDARTRNGQVVVSWRTASETNNAGFQIQHRGPSTDAWEKSGFVEGSGTTDQPQSYRFTTEYLPVGTHEFRLKQVDLDGSTTVYDPVAVEVKMQQALWLAAPTPNPVRTAASVSFAVNEAEQTRLTLYNVLGQTVRTVYQGTPPADETRTTRLSTADLASGVYFLRLRAGGRARTHRLTVVK